MNHFDRRQTRVQPRVRSSPSIGATGDTKRKLLPALYQRFKSGQFDERSLSLASRAQALTNAGSRRPRATRSRGSKGVPGAPRRSTTSSRSSLEHFRMKRSGARSRACAIDPKVVRAFYLAIAPDLFGPTILRVYRQKEVLSPRRPRGDRKAARPRSQLVEQINDDMSKIFKEDQIFRIDHYLGRDGAEPARAALRQHHVRAAVDGRRYRPRADHGRRNGRRRGPRRLLRHVRRAARHGAEPSCCSSSASWRWRAPALSTRTPCATRS